MQSMTSNQRRSLSQHLLPLAVALSLVVGLILALTWGALQVQVALAGFLNGESVWSKAQKQSVIDLDTYAAKGDPAALANYKFNYGLLMADQWVRDQTASGNYDYDQVVKALQQSKTVTIAIPGVI